MATYDQILTKRYPGRIWTLSDTADYATLAWDAGNPDAKPSQATLDGFSAAVDAELAADATAGGQARTFLALQPDIVLTGFEQVLKMLKSLYDAMPAQQRNNVETAPYTTMRAKIIQIRNNID